MAKIISKGEYHNQPMGLHFDGAGEFELDADRVAYLLKDAPDNFSLPPAATSASGAEPDLTNGSGDEEPKDKAFNKAPKDTAIKEPKKTK